MSGTLKIFVVAAAIIAISLTVGFFVFRGSGAADILMPAAPIVVSHEVPVTHMDLPPIVRAVYLTAYSAGSKGEIAKILELRKTTELNTVVIDVKDFSGYVSYDSQDPQVEAFHTKDVKIKNIRALLNTLHENGIYAIGRITIFQDPALTLAKPDWAIHKKSDPTKLWTDFKGLAWIDPAGTGVWDYIVGIGKDAVAQGFDELNFDYVRFPSDGNLEDTHYPFWDEQTKRVTVMRNFFEYLRAHLVGVRLSIDFFGLTTVQTDDMGIGQYIEDAYANFDFVSPMVYPSHYAPGTFNFKVPAQHPYDVVSTSLTTAFARLGALQKNAHPTSTFAVLRPWLQDFDLLGVPYGLPEVTAQIQATKDALGVAYRGYMLWNAGNVYTDAALNE